MRQKSTYNHLTDKFIFQKKIASKISRKEFFIFSAYNVKGNGKN